MHINHGKELYNTKMRIVWYGWYSYMWVQVELFAQLVLWLESNSC